jgi:hypothetical protein
MDADKNLLKVLVEGQVDQSGCEANEYNHIDYVDMRSQGTGQYGRPLSICPTMDAQLSCTHRHRDDCPFPLCFTKRIIAAKGELVEMMIHTTGCRGFPTASIGTGWITRCCTRLYAGRRRFSTTRVIDFVKANVSTCVSGSIAG